MAFSPNLVHAEPSSACSLEQLSAQPQQKLASAGVFANAANRAGSLRFESAEMLRAAVRELEKRQNCSVSKCPGSGEIAFEVIPNKTLSTYSDYQSCAEFEAKTTTSRLKFSEQRFDTLESLAEWIGDFSQGKGTLGQELYRLCPGACSPRYFHSIRLSGGEFFALPTAVCGHARDKDDNQYQLRYSLSCGAAVSQ